MKSFDTETLAIILGDTPKKKNENAKFLVELALKIAFPRCGTIEEELDRGDLAEIIFRKFPTAKSLKKE